MPLSSLLPHSFRTPAGLLGWLLLLGAGLPAITAPAQAQATPDTLLVGTRVAPPFVTRLPDGTWTGISIELWEEVAEALGLSYTVMERSLPGLLDSVATGQLDAGVAALTITADREARMDFSQPFFTSGLRIAVPSDRSWWDAIRAFVSLQFLQVVLALAGLLLLVGLGVWLLERRANPEQFGGSAAEGIASGFWWSAVTMTTVGYGDKAPVSWGGRLLGLVWMFVAIILISSFTAAITSSLTVNRLETDIRGPADLRRVDRVGTVTASTSFAYLERSGIQPLSYDTPEAALDALAAGELSALVYDAPILRYLVKTRYANRVQVLPGTFQTEYYGIALPPESPLREPITREVLAYLSSPAYAILIERYLGE